MGARVYLDVAHLEPVQQAVGQVDTALISVRS